MTRAAAATSTEQSPADEGRGRETLLLIDYSCFGGSFLVGGQWGDRGFASANLGVEGAEGTPLGVLGGKAGAIFEHFYIGGGLNAELGPQDGGIVFGAQLMASVGFATGIGPGLRSW